MPDDKGLADRIVPDPPVRLGGRDGRDIHADEMAGRYKALKHERDTLADRGRFLKQQLDAKDQEIKGLRAQLADAATASAQREADWDKASRHYHQGLADIAGQRYKLAAELKIVIAQREAMASDIATANYEQLAAKDGATGGYWARISFMGHLEYAGWVTEPTRNGQPAYRIELPDYLWAADATAWVEHSAASWFSTIPLSEAVVREAWEAEQRRKADRARWEAERAEQRLALQAPITIAPVNDEDLDDEDLDDDQDDDDEDAF